MAATSELRVFFDADVLLSAAAPASPTSAASILLQLAELTLIEGICCPYVVEQVRRNLHKFSAKVANVDLDQEFLRLKTAAFIEVPDPPPDALSMFQGHADEEDIPVLAAAVQNRCRYLVTGNVRDYPQAEGAT